MIFKGKNRTSYRIIEPAIGKGGEGSVYKIDGMPNFVLKAFIASKRTEKREKKLLAMIASPVSDKAMEHITWPKDVVYENGQFAGYIMPRTSNNNENLNVMYSPSKYTKDKFIKKIRIARNLCAAINSVHKAGQVCGDFNPHNITVNPQSGRITLVDTDSYHITEKNSNRTYRCEVGMPEYLAPEIHEKLKNHKRLDTAPLPTFTRQTDLFALAVHIFALLMNGCHPFACATDLSKNQTSVAAPQPVENIRNGFFPFYMNKSGFTIPKYAPNFNQLPQKIKRLFIRAFVDGHKNPQVRPNTSEWYNALEWYSNLLKMNKLAIPQPQQIQSFNKTKTARNTTISPPQQQQPIMPLSSVAPPMPMPQPQPIQQSFNTVTAQSMQQQSTTVPPSIPQSQQQQQLFNFKTVFLIIAIVTIWIIAIVIAFYIGKNHIVKNTNNSTTTTIDTGVGTGIPHTSTSTETQQSSIQQSQNENYNYKIDADNVDDIMNQVLNGNEAMLRNYSLSELRIIRNTIYARKGYIFKSDDLRNYFEKKSWYSGYIYDENQVPLSSREKKFVNTIKRYE